MPFPLNWVGFPLAFTILAVIAYRVFNLWLPIIPSVITLRHLEREDQSDGQTVVTTANTAVAI